MRKAITPVISIIILLLITIAIAGMAWTYLSGQYSAMTAKAIKLVPGSVNNNEVMILNMGTADITLDDLQVMVNGQESTVIMIPDTIEPKQSARLLFKSPVIDTVSVRAVAPGGGVSFSTDVETQAYLEDEYEGFDNGAVCSHGMYVLENSRVKFFAPVPRVYNTTSEYDCASRTVDRNQYGASPLRIWAKGTNADTYRVNNSVIDQTRFQTSTLTFTFPDQPSISGTHIITYVGNIQSNLEPSVTYTLLPDKIYVKVEFAVKNVGTADTPVTLRWEGDQDGAGVKHFQSGFEASGNGPYQLDAGERWVAQWTGNTDVMGYIAPENAEVEIIGGYEGIRVEETSATTISPDQSHTFTFYIMAAPKGPPGQEWAPVEEAYNELF